MKKLLISLACVICISLVSCDYQSDSKPTDDSVVDVSLQTDFSFFITWGNYGISSYDSKTGKLIKTTDATYPEKYITKLNLSESNMNKVHKILTQDIVLYSYDDVYDPFNAPDAEQKKMSEPNQTIIITIQENGKSKTITCKDIALASYSDCYCKEAENFMQAVHNIVQIITESPEWLNLPEYERYYD